MKSESHAGDDSQLCAKVDHVFRLWAEHDEIWEQAHNLREELEARDDYPQTPPDSNELPGDWHRRILDPYWQQHGLTALYDSGNKCTGHTIEAIREAWAIEPATVRDVHARLRLVALASRNEDFDSACWTAMELEPDPEGDTEPAGDMLAIVLADLERIMGRAS